MPNPLILLYCSESEACQELAINLAQKYKITLTRHFHELESLVAEGDYSMVLVEIPANQEDILKTLDRVFQRKPQTQVILLNGSPEQKTIASAFRLGVSDYFPQPINVSLLSERVDAFVR